MLLLSGLGRRRDVIAERERERVGSGDQHEADADEDARRSTALLNAGLQVGYAILGIRAAGLAAGPMTGLDADAVTREFFPDGRHQVLAVVNIGRPAEGAWMDRLPRLPYEDAVTLL